MKFSVNLMFARAVEVRVPGPGLSRVVKVNFRLFEQRTRDVVRVGRYAENNKKGLHYFDIPLNGGRGNLDVLGDGIE
jgi:hypothetical protein